MSERTNAPISVHGLISLILSIGFLAEGLLRGELIASLAGMALAGLNAFALAVILISWFQVNGYSAGLEKDPAAGYSVIPREGERRTIRKATFTQVSLRVELLSEGYGDKKTVEFPLPESLTAARMPDLPRGRYAVASYRCVIADFANLFKIPTKRIREPSGTTLIIPSCPAKAEAFKFPVSAAGNTRGASTFLRSEELYEARQFRPGDDKRKINWKAYAHSGELIVREGELLPPPAREYTVLFWTPEGRSTHRQQFELLVSRAHAICLELLRSGKNLKFPLFPEIHIRHDDPKAYLLLQEALAYPSTGNSMPFFQDLKTGDTLICFTLPPMPLGRRKNQAAESRDIPNLLYDFRERLTFYIGPIKENTTETADQSVLRNALFYPENNGANSAQGLPKHFAERYLSYLERKGFRAYPI